MENASKALLMAAGVLLGLMILVVAGFLFTSLGAFSQNAENDRIAQQTAKFNYNFIKFEGSKEVTAHDIVSIANLARENNKNYEVEDIAVADRPYSFYITVTVNGVGVLTDKNALGNYKTSLDDFINQYSSHIETNSETGEQESKTTYFTCTNVTISNSTKRVSSITFSLNRY